MIVARYVLVVWSLIGLGIVYAEGTSLEKRSWIGGVGAGIAFWLGPFLIFFPFPGSRYPAEA